MEEEVADLNETILDTDNEGPVPKAPRTDREQQVTYVMTAEQLQQLLPVMPRTRPARRRLQHQPCLGVSPRSTRDCRDSAAQLKGGAQDHRPRRCGVLLGSIALR